MPNRRARQKRALGVDSSETNLLGMGPLGGFAPPRKYATRPTPSPLCGVRQPLFGLQRRCAGAKATKLSTAGKRQLSTPYARLWKNAAQLFHRQPRYPQTDSQSTQGVRATPSLLVLRFLTSHSAAGAPCAETQKEISGRPSSMSAYSPRGSDLSSGEKVFAAAHIRAEMMSSNCPPA